MPLLMCPNCHTGMKEIDREGVKVDMCPQCHGVWLDRGELQKLLDSVEDRPGSPAGGPTPAQQQYMAPPPAPGAPQYPPQHQYPPQPGWHRKHDDSDDPYYKHGKHYKKSKFERIFDIFD